MSLVAPATMLPANSMWMDSSGTPGDLVSLSSISRRSAAKIVLTLGFRNAQDGVHDHDDAGAAED